MTEPRFIPNALHTTVTVVLAVAATVFSVALFIAPLKLGWHPSMVLVPVYLSLLNGVLILLYGIYRQYHPSKNLLRDALIGMSPVVWLLWIILA